MKRIRAVVLLPGVMLSAALAAMAFPAARFAGTSLLGLERSPLSPVLVGVLAGVALRNLVSLPEAVRPGVRFAASRILRLGIILLGVRLSVVDVARFGALGLPVVAACVLAGLLVTGLLARVFTVPRRLGVLIGVGTSICGVSAIAATGPVIHAEDDEVAYATIVITVFGMIAMLAYPFASHALFGGNETAAGLFLGTAIHDTSQVNGAGILYADAFAAPRTLDVAVVTKLLRNLFMIVVIPAMAFRHRASSGPVPAASAPGAVSLLRLFPLFVLGFLAMAAFRTAGDVQLGSGRAFGIWDLDAWREFCRGAQTLSGACLVTALSAVGLGTDLSSLRRLKGKPFLLGLGAAVAVGVVSFVAVSSLMALGWVPAGGQP
ncbi:putative sulfate exporter family transporter [bacterium]|nr:putative sulfate exporter family transporter [bacterium]